MTRQVALYTLLPSKRIKRSILELVIFGTQRGIKR